jgi:hypothetical protein
MFMFIVRTVTPFDELDLMLQAVLGRRASSDEDKVVGNS